MPRDLYGRVILLTDTPVHRRLSVPDHKSLCIGTLYGILRDVARAKHTTREAILARYEGPIVRFANPGWPARLKIAPG